MSRLAGIRGIIRGRGELNRDAPGSSVVQRGLQTKTLKNLKVMVPFGKRKRLRLVTQVVTEYTIDTALLSEQRAILQHIATLCGT